MNKSLVSLLFFLIAFLTFHSSGEAKSYSIDKVHIKSWIQPNGDLLVNEIFTYTFDGSFHNLYRACGKSTKKPIWYTIYDS